jgi:hypothetical protein
MVADLGGVRLDKEKALSILERIVSEAGALPADGEWVRIIQEMSDLVANGQPKTHLAVLATALLARATNDRVDPFCLKANKGEGSYDARSISDFVLAPNVRRLGFNIGAMGANPLNNSPYRGPASVRDAESRLRSSARPQQLQRSTVARQKQANNHPLPVPSGRPAQFPDTWARRHDHASLARAAGNHT